MKLGRRRIIDRKPVYVPWCRDLKIMRLRYVTEVTEKGETHVGKVDAILTDSHLDTRTKRCILMNVIVTKPEYAEA